MGRLTTTSTLAVPQARIDVLQRQNRRGAREANVGSALTDDDGNFWYGLPARLPSRTVRLTYEPAVLTQATSAVLKLRVRAAAQLHASLRGTRIRFAGRVLSGPLPKNGKQVLLQGRAPGYAWARFAKLRTDRKGRFSGSYRLAIHRPGVRLQIRAVVPTERGYPYLSCHSRPIRLRVR
jgi:hypothetical protein